MATASPTPTCPAPRTSTPGCRANPAGREPWKRTTRFATIPEPTSSTASPSAIPVRSRKGSPSPSLPRSRRLDLGEGRLADLRGLARIPATLATTHAGPGSARRADLKIVGAYPDGWHLSPTRRLRRRRSLPGGGLARRPGDGDEAHEPRQIAGRRNVERALREVPQSVVLERDEVRDELRAGVDERPRACQGVVVRIRHVIETIRIVAPGRVVDLRDVLRELRHGLRAVVPEAVHPVHPARVGQHRVVRGVEHVQVPGRLRDL